MMKDNWICLRIACQLHLISVESQKLWGVATLHCTVLLVDWYVDKNSYEEKFCEEHHCVSVAITNEKACISSCYSSPRGFAWYALP